MQRLRIDEEFLLDLGNHKLMRGDVEISLTPKVFPIADSFCRCSRHDS